MTEMKSLQMKSCDFHFSSSVRHFFRSFSPFLSFFPETSPILAGCHHVAWANAYTFFVLACVIAGTHTRAQIQCCIRLEQAHWNVFAKWKQWQQSAHCLCVMSDEETSLAGHESTTATAIGRSALDDSHGTSKCNSIINNKRHEAAENCATTSICSSGLSTDKSAVTVAVDNVRNECEPPDITLTIPTTSATATRPTTMASIVRRPNASPTVILTMPSIAVTSDSSVVPTPITSTTKRTCKRTGKIDFVRFDSVETIYKQTDHDEVIRRATVKDEIKA